MNFVGKTWQNILGLAGLNDFVSSLISTFHIDLHTFTYPFCYLEHLGKVAPTPKTARNTLISTLSTWLCSFRSG